MTVIVYFSAIDEELKSILNSLEISQERMVKLIKQIRADCQDNLNLESQLKTRMLETFARKFPQGHEQGEFIVVDFGGRFFRFDPIQFNEKRN